MVPHEPGAQWLFEKKNKSLIQLTPFNFHCWGEKSMYLSCGPWIWYWGRDPQSTWMWTPHAQELNMCVCVRVCEVWVHCCCCMRSSTKDNLEQQYEVLIDFIGYLKTSISSGALWECRASFTTPWSDGDIQSKNAKDQISVSQPGWQTEEQLQYSTVFCIGLPRATLHRHQWYSQFSKSWTKIDRVC